MAFNDVEGSFVQLAPDNHNPKRIPEHYGRFYDEAFGMYQKFSHFGGVRDIPHNDWPLICLLAEHRKRIVDLEERLNEALSAPRRGRPPKGVTDDGG